MIRTAFCFSITELTLHANRFTFRIGDCGCLELEAKVKITTPLYQRSGIFFLILVSDYWYVSCKSVDKKNKEATINSFDSYLIKVCTAMNSNSTEMTTSDKSGCVSLFFSCVLILKISVILHSSRNC